MKNFFTSKSFKITAAVFFIMFGLILYSASTGGSFFSKAVNFITTPLHQITAGATNAIEDATGLQKSKDELIEENKKLKEQVQQLSTILVDYYDIKTENEQFMKYFQIQKTKPEYSLMPATVIVRDPSDNFYGCTLDKGSLNGVEVNDAVVTESGLIGWVYQVEPTSCKIKTILSPDAKVGALDKPSKDSGIISGGAELADENQTRLTVISEQNNIKPGDLIVTSGIGGVYPGDLIVGTVKGLKYDSFDASLYAVIEPYEDIRNVTEVVIITEFTEKSIISVKDEGGNESNTTKPKTEN